MPLPRGRLAAVFSPMVSRAPMRGNPVLARVAPGAPPPIRGAIPTPSVKGGATEPSAPSDAGGAGGLKKGGSVNRDTKARYKSPGTFKS